MFQIFDFHFSRWDPGEATLKQILFRLIPSPSSGFWRNYWDFWVSWLIRILLVERSQWLEGWCVVATWTPGAAVRLFNKLLVFLGKILALHQPQRFVVHVAAVGEFIFTERCIFSVNIIPPLFYALSSITNAETLLIFNTQGLSKRFENLLLWPPRSPDLTHCDFFLRGYVKDNAYKPQTARSHSSCGANH